jgi:hypothetical protein
MLHARDDYYTMSIIEQVPWDVLIWGREYFFEHDRRLVKTFRGGVGLQECEAGEQETHEKYWLACTFHLLSVRFHSALPFVRAC